MASDRAGRREGRRFGSLLQRGTFERALLLIVLVALVGRVAYIVVAKTEVDSCGRSVCGDALFYSAEANVLARGHGFQEISLNGQPAADHPPLTVVVLAITNLPVLWTTANDIPPGGGLPPSNMFVQRLTMALLGALVITLLGLLGRRVAGRRAGLIVAGLAAVNPNFWMNDVLPMSETLATLGIVVILVGIYRFIDRPSVGRASFLAVATGLAILSRAELALFIPVTIVPVMLMTKSLPFTARLGRIAVVAVGAGLMLLPWFAFNQSRFSEPVLLSTNDGITLLGANCDAVYGVPEDGGMGFWNLGCPLALGDRIPRGADQSVVSRIYRQAGVEYIRNHKRLLPRVESIRLARAWGVFAPDQMVWLNQGEGRDAWASWLGYAMWWLLMPGAVVGAMILRRRRVPAWPLVSTAVIVSVTVGVFYGIVRFRLPADVAAVVLAGVAVDALVRRVRQETTTPDSGEVPDVPRPGADPLDARDEDRTPVAAP